MIGLSELAVNAVNKQFDVKIHEVIAKTKNIPSLCAKYKCNVESNTFFGSPISDAVVLFTNNTISKATKMLVIYLADKEAEYNKLEIFNFSKNDLIIPTDLTTVYHSTLFKLEKKYLSVSPFLRDVKLLRTLRKNHLHEIDTRYSSKGFVRRNYLKYIQGCPYITTSSNVLLDRNTWAAWTMYENIFSLNTFSSWQEAQWEKSNTSNIYSAIDTKTWEIRSELYKFQAVMELLYIIMTKEIILKKNLYKAVNNLHSDDLFYYFQHAIMLCVNSFNIGELVTLTIIDNIDEILDGFDSIFYRSRFMTFKNKNKLDL
jgi:hypothetical protein